MGRMERRLLTAGSQVEAATGGGHKKPRSREAQRRVPERALTPAKFWRAAAVVRGPQVPRTKSRDCPERGLLTVIATSQLPALTGVRPLLIQGPGNPL